MNIFATLSLIGFLLSLELGLVILVRDFKKRENQVFSLYALSAALNAFIEYGYRQAETFAEAKLWWRVDVFWILPIAFLFHFVFLFTGKKAILRKKMTYVLLYGTSLIIMGIELTTDMITREPVQELWGWSYSTDHWNLFNMFFSIIVTFALLYAVVILVRYWKSTRDSCRKHQAVYIGVGLSLPISAGIGTEVIAPYLGLKLPYMTNTALIAGVLVIAYSVWKYSTLSFSPRCVEESIIGTMRESIILVTNNRTISSVNSALEKLVGYETKELIGTKLDVILNRPDTISCLFPEHDRPEAFDDHIVYDHETVICRNDGIEIPVSLSASLFRDRGGSVRGIICSLWDITRHVITENELREHRHHLEDLVKERTKELSLEIEEHRRTANALSASEGLYRTLVETSPDAIIMIDETCALLKVNRQAVSLYGFEDEKDMLARRRTLHELFVEEERGLAVRLCRENPEPENIHDVELNMLRNNGTRFTAEIRTSVVRNEDHAPKSYLMVVRDITRKKHIEEKLRLRQRIDSIGHLAAGIAHDFNNLLTGIMGNINILELDREQLNPEHRTCLDEAMISVEKAALLIREFQTLSRESYAERRNINVVDIVRLVTDRISREHTGRDIPVKMHLEEVKCHVTGDLDQLTQVLHHIVRNAIQAIEEKGVSPDDKVIISANSRRIGANDITGLSEGEYVQITIVDTGVGMSEDVRRRAFDPMFTTRMRSSQKGQGLGLAMVYNIITNNHNGSVDILSTKGIGTTVHLLLPASYTETEIDMD